MEVHVRMYDQNNLREEYIDGNVELAHITTDPYSITVSTPEARVKGWLAHDIEVVILEPLAVLHGKIYGIVKRSGGDGYNVTLSIATAQFQFNHVLEQTRDNRQN